MGPPFNSFALRQGSFTAIRQAHLENRTSRLIAGQVSLFIDTLLVCLRSKPSFLVVLVEQVLATKGDGCSIPFLECVTATVLTQETGALTMTHMLRHSPMLYPH